MTDRQTWYRETYLTSRYWKWMRKKIARRAGWMCEVKGCRKHGPALNAHHTVYRLFFEWVAPWELVYLCPRHHADTHAGITLTLRRKFLFWNKRLKPKR